MSVRVYSGPHADRHRSGPRVLRVLPWLLAFALVSAELVTAKAISAMITSATSTRSYRPRRSQRGRGAGGFVVSVTNVAANLLTAVSMPPA